MAPAPPGFNYAAAFGIRSLAAPVVFALFYAPLLALFLAKGVRRPNYVFFVLAFFCARACPAIPACAR